MVYCLLMVTVLMSSGRSQPLSPSRTSDWEPLALLPSLSWLTGNAPFWRLLNPEQIVAQAGGFLIMSCFLPSSEKHFSEYDPHASESSGYFQRCTFLYLSSQVQTWSVEWDLGVCICNKSLLILMPSEVWEFLHYWIAGEKHTLSSLHPSQTCPQFSLQGELIQISRFLSLYSKRNVCL